MRWRVSWIFPQTPPNIKKDSHTTPDALMPIFKEVEGGFDLPSGLPEKMASAESSWDTHALSNRGASGLKQLMPDTAKRFYVDDPDDSKRCGALHAVAAGQVRRQSGKSRGHLQCR